MNTQIFVGNLGANARVETANGRQFLSFHVGDNRRWKDDNGVDHEETTWVSCAYNGKFDNLLPYLVKGQLVCVIGRISTRIYSSEKQRRMVAGINMAVDRIELLGSKKDSMPSMLYDKQGIGYQVYKAYYISADVLQQIGLNKAGDEVTLMTPDGTQYTVYNGGWIKPVQVPAATSEATNQDQQDKPEDNQSDNAQPF